MDSIIIFLINAITVYIAEGKMHVTERKDALVCVHKGNPDINAVNDCVQCAIKYWIESLWNYEYSDTLWFLFNLPLFVKQNWRLILNEDCGCPDINKFNRDLFLFLNSDEIKVFGTMTLVESLLMRAHFRDGVDFSIYWSASFDFPAILAKALEIAKSRDEEGYMCHKDTIGKQCDLMLIDNETHLIGYGMIDPKVVE
jgi:hypothetical protein